LEETSGDVLVFLPGRREIEQFIQSARERFVALDLTVLPLHGGLDAKAQDAVLQGRDDARRRLIAATDLAETSLTIEGLTAVVDAGLARRPRFDPRSGMTRLETRRISQASATQRAGRAGRLGPGQAYRAWTPERHARLETQSRPEILDADLSPVQLEIAAWGATPQALDWVDTPTDAAWSAATGLLVALGAVNANGTITEQGKAMQVCRSIPRLAHLLVGSTAPTDVALAIDLAALLSEPDPLRHGRPTTARCGSARSIGAVCASCVPDSPHLTVSTALPSETYSRLASNSATWYQARPDLGASDQGIDRALLLAYPDRIAQLVSADGRRYRLRNGRAATLHESDPLIGSPFLVVPALDFGEREGRIFLAVPLDRATIEEALLDAIEDRRELRWDDVIGDVVARRIRAIDAIVLDDQAVSLSADDDLIGVLSESSGPCRARWAFGTAGGLFGTRRVDASTGTGAGLAGSQRRGAVARSGRLARPLVGYRRCPSVAQA
jgi:ATP-dependent helicase HrpB